MTDGPPGELTDPELGLLRSALVTADYTVNGVLSALSPLAHAALGRGERVPALGELTGAAPLPTLARLFLLGTAEPALAVAAALGRLPLERAVAGGLLAPVGAGELRAALDVRPYGDPARPWYVVSDATAPPGVDAARPLRGDHVLGVGGASLTLAGATPPGEVGSALDIGTGSGVQALHLSVRAGTVVATDRNPRALRLARMTAALSEAGPWQLLAGDLLAPVAGRRFDLVVSNPPFVIGPEARFSYRDSGLPGDEVARRLVAEVRDHLTEGGTAVVLANWLHRSGEGWTDRVLGWLRDSGCDAVAVQREVQDPARYAELWLRDSGDHRGADYERRYAGWLDYFTRAGVEAVGFGVVALRRPAPGAAPTVRAVDVPHPLDPPAGPLGGPAGSLGATLAGWLDRAELARRGDEDLLATPFAVADGVRLHQVARAGEEGWEVVEQRIRQDGGLRLSGGIDAFGAALVAGCDGTTPLAAIVEVLAAAHGLAADEVVAGVLPAVRDLAEQGFLLPVSAGRRSTG